MTEMYLFAIFYNQISQSITYLFMIHSHASNKTHLSNCIFYYGLFSENEFVMYDIWLFQRSLSRENPVPKQRFLPIRQHVAGLRQNSKGGCLKIVILRCDKNRFLKCQNSVGYLGTLFLSKCHHKRLNDSRVVYQMDMKALSSRTSFFNIEIITWRRPVFVIQLNYYESYSIKRNQRTFEWGCISFHGLLN